MVTPIASSVYQDIVQALLKLGPSLSPVKYLVAAFPSVHIATLRQICSQHVQQKTRRSFAKHFSSSSMENYYQKYLAALKQNEPPGILLRLALQLDIAPAMLCRIILEQDMMANNYRSVNKKAMTQLLKDTSLIEDGLLAHEVQLCVLSDEYTGPMADAANRSLGHEYECKIKRKLQEKKIPFFDENQMRANGYDKTPDYKLEIPFATNGFIVNWIESKAAFGDAQSHKHYSEDQFLSYWNRFGSGLVIYWFGYIKELTTETEKRFMVQCDFPSDIVMMDPTNVESP